MQKHSYSFCIVNKKPQPSTNALAQSRDSTFCLLEVKAYGRITIYLSLC